MTYLLGSQAANIAPSFIAQAIKADPEEVRIALIELKKMQPELLRKILSAKKTLICYSQSDSEFALKLTSELENVGFSYIMNLPEPSLSPLLDPGIVKSLEECENLIVILSTKSIKSDSLMGVASVALGEGKTLIPLVISNCLIPLRFSQRQPIDFTKSYEDGFMMLKNILGKLSLEEENVQERNVKGFPDSNTTATKPPAQAKKPELENKTKTFICYSSYDSDFTSKLAAELRKNGCNIWLDQLDIPPGSNWDDEIEKALNECHHLLVILSPNSVASQDVKNEIAYALKKSKKVLTLMFKECEVPYRIDRLQRIDFTKSYDEGFKKLSKALWALK